DPGADAEARARTLPPRRGRIRARVLADRGGDDRRLRAVRAAEPAAAARPRLLPDLDAQQPARDRVRALALVPARGRGGVPARDLHRLRRDGVGDDADGARAAAHALARGEPGLVRLARPDAV